MVDPFVEEKRRLVGETVEFRCLLLERTDERLVLRYDLPEGGVLGGLVLPPGSVTFAYYWPTLPYNVYHWMDPDGETIAFYLNLSGPIEIQAARVIWTDYIVDLLITPDERLGYRVAILDEENLPTTLDPAIRSQIDAALVEALRSWPALVRQVSAHSRRLWPAP